MAIVTINTDASYHRFYKVGAYAFWIVCEGVRMIQSGPFKTVRDAHDAEMKAIGNALYALLQSEFKNVKFIVVNTDCQHAIKAIRDSDKNFYKGSEDTAKHCRKLVKQLREKYNIGPAKYRKSPFISWRYVPAHSESENARLWVNNYLDRAAKQALGVAIEKKKTG